MESVPPCSRRAVSPPVVYPYLRKRYRCERDRVGARGVPGRGAAAGGRPAGRVGRDRVRRGARAGRAAQPGRGVVPAAVLEIVAERGKMQNPVTGSGGMLVGVVDEVGPSSPLGLRAGDRIATLVS